MLFLFRSFDTKNVARAIFNPYFNYFTINFKQLSWPVLTARLQR